MSNYIGRLSRQVRSLRHGWKPFYRRCGLHRLEHPVQASASVPVIDARIIVSHANRMLFVRVPKCANTTILHTLWMCEAGRRPEELEGMSEEERAEMQRKKNMKRLFTSPSRLSAEETARVFTEYTKAIVVRNPFTRLASAYLYEIRGKKKAWRYGLSPSLSFAGFCDYLRDGNLHADIHWMPQSHICPLKPEQLDFIGRMETLADDLPALTERVYGLSADIFSRRRHATNADQKVRELYTEREWALVADLYAADFDFGYSPERIG